MSGPDPERSAERRATRALERHPDLPQFIAAGLPLRATLDLLGIDRGLEGPLAELPPIRSAVAQRVGTLVSELRSPEKGTRDGALAELERVHGWRKPPPLTVEERFDAVLTEFRDLDPDGHARLYAILMRDGETAAERRKRKRAS